MLLMANATYDRVMNQWWIANGPWGRMTNTRIHVQYKVIITRLTMVSNPFTSVIWLSLTGSVATMINQMNLQNWIIIMNHLCDVSEQASKRQSKPCRISASPSSCVKLSAPTFRIRGTSDCQAHDGSSDSAQAELSPPVMPSHELLLLVPSVCQSVSRIRSTCFQSAAQGWPHWPSPAMNSYINQHSALTIIHHHELTINSASTSYQYLIMYQLTINYNYS